jgi:putative PIN family toxin of toxin-antitoxin system
VTEFISVSARPRLQVLFAADDRRELLELLQYSPMIDEMTPVTVCRDPKDDYLLALAKAGNADILVTRDEDLLVITQYGETEIIYPAEFLKRLAEMAS